jgi:hypothetical protein
MPVCFCFSLYGVHDSLCHQDLDHLRHQEDTSKLHTKFVLKNNETTLFGLELSNQNTIIALPLTSGSEPSRPPVQPLLEVPPADKGDSAHGKASSSTEVLRFKQSGYVKSLVWQPIECTCGKTAGQAKYNPSPGAY